MAQPAAPTDRDLASIADARHLVRRAKATAPVLAEFTQQQIDAIVDAMAAAVTPHAEALARITELGIDYAQGYFIARPMPAGELGRWAVQWEQRRAEILPQLA